MSRLVCRPPPVLSPCAPCPRKPKTKRKYAPEKNLPPAPCPSPRVVGIHIKTSCEEKPSISMSHIRRALPLPRLMRTDCMRQNAHLHG